MASGRGGASGVPLPCAKRHVRDLCPVSLRMEQRCGRFLRERPAPPWLRGGLRSLSLPLADECLTGGKKSKSACIPRAHAFTSWSAVRMMGRRQKIREFLARTVGVVHGGDGAADEHARLLYAFVTLAVSMPLVRPDRDGRRADGAGRVCRRASTRGGGPSRLRGVARARVARNGREENRGAVQCRHRRDAPTARRAYARFGDESGVNEGLRLEGEREIRTGRTRRAEGGRGVVRAEAIAQGPPSASCSRAQARVASGIAGLESGV